MSRSGYSDDHDNWAMIKWRGMVASSIRGKRGQKLLRDLLEALDAMPEKALIAGELVEEGDVCTLGALGQARSLDMTNIDPTEPKDVATAFDIAPCLAQEIVYENDEHSSNETPEQRWKRMRAWVASKIVGERGQASPLAD